MNLIWSWQHSAWRDRQGYYWRYVPHPEGNYWGRWDWVPCGLIFSELPS